MKIQRVIIVGGFNNEEMIPTLVEGFLDAGLRVDRIPSRGVIEMRRVDDLRFADKEIMPFPTLPETTTFRDDRDFMACVRDTVATGSRPLVLWWYAKDDRPAGLVESLDCPTVRFSWDDPMAIEAFGEDWSRGFTHAVTGCRSSIKHYADRGIKALWTLPPVSPTRHGQAVPTPGEECDIAATFYTLYDGQADWLRERVKRRDLIEAAAGLGKLHVYGGYGRGEFKGVPRTAYRGFRTNIELPGVFAAAKIVVTQHPQIDAEGYVSPRDMEALASGAFVLSDDADGVLQEFTDWFGVYRNLDEFRRFARFWLEHDGQRRDDIEATRRYVLENYSGKQFAKRLLEFIT